LNCPTFEFIIAVNCPTVNCEWFLVNRILACIFMIFSNSFASIQKSRKLLQTLQNGTYIFPLSITQKRNYFPAAICYFAISKKQISFPFVCMNKIVDGCQNARQIFIINWNIHKSYETQMSNHVISHKICVTSLFLSLSPSLLSI
jgi:hypothetical protein